MVKKCFPFFTLLPILLIVFSCDKDEKDEIETQGKASAMVNGKVWTGEVNVMDRGSNMHLAIDKFKDVYGAYVPWESISFGFVDKKTDSIQRVFNRDSLASTAPWLVTKVSGSFGTNQDDGDVLCDFYEVIEEDSVNNWVRIDKQLGNFTEVWGSFGMRLYRVETCEATEYPDTLLITDGKFHFSL